MIDLSRPTVLPTGDSVHTETAPAPLTRAPAGTRYVLPGAVMSDFGLWEYVYCTPEQAREWLGAGPYLSCLGDHETALALTRLVDVQVPRGRWRVVRLQPEDDALVFVLSRLEIGWMKRLG